MSDNIFFEKSEFSDLEQAHIFAPCSEKILKVSKPIPLFVPVITTFLFFNNNVKPIIFLFLKIFLKCVALQY